MFFYENIIEHVLYIEILKTVCKNNISLKRYCILKIGYLNKTILFGLNVAFQTVIFHYIRVQLKFVFFYGWGYSHIQKATFPLIIKIIKNGFYYMKGHISSYNGNLYPMTTGIQEEQGFTIHFRSTNVSTKGHPHLASWQGMSSPDGNFSIKISMESLGSFS